MKSKTKINKQLKGKRDPELVEAITETKRNAKWHRVSELLASPRKNKIEKNLDSIDKQSKDGETLVVPGKVLGVGTLNKSVKIVALKFSKNAMEKILKSGSKVSTIFEEIKNNPDAKRVRILE